MKCHICGCKLKVKGVTNNKYWMESLPLYIPYCDACGYESPVGSSDYGEALTIYSNYINNESGEYEGKDGEIIKI